MLIRKRNHKRWLDWTFNVTYSVVRFFIIGIGVLGFYSANWFFEGDISLERYLSWGAFLALCFTALTFLFFGYPSTIPAALKEVKPKLQNSIYGKYLGIEGSISSDEKEIIEIKKELKNLDLNA